MLMHILGMYLLVPVCPFHFCSEVKHLNLKFTLNNFQGQKHNGENQRTCWSFFFEKSYLCEASDLGCSVRKGGGGNGTQIDQHSTKKSLQIFQSNPIKQIDLKYQTSG